MIFENGNPFFYQISVSMQTGFQTFVCNFGGKSVKNPSTYHQVFNWSSTNITDEDFKTLCNPIPILPLNTSPIPTQWPNTLYSISLETNAVVCQCPNSYCFLEAFIIFVSKSTIYKIANFLPNFMGDVKAPIGLLSPSYLQICQRFCQG